MFIYIHTDQLGYHTYKSIYYEMNLGPVAAASKPTLLLLRACGCQAQKGPLAFLVFALHVGSEAATRLQGEE